MKRRNRLLSLLLLLATLLSLTLPCAGVDLSEVSEIVSRKTVDAKAALLVNSTENVIYYEQNARERVYPASITKVMTALLTVEAIDRGDLTLDQVITAGDQTWLDIPADGSTANIQVGEELTVEQLLYCLMLPSANEAANILAQAISGQVSSFVALMNLRAEQLGCTDTHFMNPHGIHHTNHYTTCYDLYLIARKALENATFRQIVSTDEITIPPTNMTAKERVYYNTNALLTHKKYPGYEFPDCIGIKTGSTDAAGYCLLSAARRDGNTLISVVMGAETVVDTDGTHRKQFSESASLLQWGFDNFSYHSILDNRDPVAEVPVTLSSQTDGVLVAPAESISALLPDDVSGDAFTRDVEVVESVAAPVETGQELGTMTLYLQGKKYGTVPLVALNDVKASQLLTRKHEIEQVISSPWFRGLLLLAAAVMAVIILKNTVFYQSSRVRAAKRNARKVNAAQPKSYKGKR